MYGTCTTHFLLKFHLFLQYDIDGNGMMDILIVTSSGDLMFFTPNGTALKDKFFEVGIQ